MVHCAVVRKGEELVHLSRDEVGTHTAPQAEGVDVLALEGRVVALKREPPGKLREIRGSVNFQTLSPLDA